MTPTVTSAWLNKHGCSAQAQLFTSVADSLVKLGATTVTFPVGFELQGEVVCFSIQPTVPGMLSRMATGFSVCMLKVQMIIFWCLLLLRAAVLFVSPHALKHCFETLGPFFGGRSRLEKGFDPSKLYRVISPVLLHWFSDLPTWDFLCTHTAVHEYLH